MAPDGNLATAATPLGRKDTHVVRLATEAPVVLAGKDGQGASSADYTAPAAGLDDAAGQWLAADAWCGLAIDVFKASDPEAPSGSCTRRTPTTTAPGCAGARSTG